MSARDEILNRLAEKSVSPESPTPMPSLPVPRFVHDNAANPVERFIHMLEQVHGSCSRIATIEQAPKEIAKYLASIKFAPTLVIAPEPQLTGLDWVGMEVDCRPAVQADTVSVTMAFSGIAETGTIVMASSAESPVTLNFLPEVNVVVLKRSRLVASIEEFWPLLDAQPRAVNFITGPSKTADIEQTIVYGAHGPRYFHVLLVDEAG